MQSIAVAIGGLIATGTATGDTGAQATENDICPACGQSYGGFNGPTAITEIPPHTHSPTLADSPDQPIVTDPDVIEVSEHTHETQIPCAECRRPI